MLGLADEFAKQTKEEDELPQLFDDLIIHSFLYF
jgi:hypothetical protein